MYFINNVSSSLPVQTPQLRKFIVNLRKHEINLLLGLDRIQRTADSGQRTADSGETNSAGYLERVPVMVTVFKLLSLQPEKYGRIRKKIPF